MSFKGLLLLFCCLDKRLYWKQKRPDKKGDEEVNAGLISLETL